ncbi:MAG: alpha-ketoglutarate-dependent dioxygenase AlkB [Chitinophagaceae bacterium]
MTLFSDTSIFTSGQPKKEKYEPEDASLVLIESFFTKEEADRLYENLLKATEWKTSQITIYGKQHDTPRLIAWYGDPGKNYTFSGNTKSTLPWTPDLLFIKEKVDKEAGVTFNSVLLNLYRTGKDSVGWHRDNEKEFGTNPIIASVSFGETRPFQLRHKFKNHIDRITIPITPGSLLIMKGSTQHFWEHQIPKTAKLISPRINLTFRIIKTAE